MSKTLGENLCRESGIMFPVAFRPPELADEEMIIYLLLWQPSNKYHKVPASCGKVWLAVKRPLASSLQVRECPISPKDFVFSRGI